MIDYCLTSFSRWQVKQTVWAAGLGLFEDLHIFCSWLFSSWEAVFWVVDVGVGGQEVKMLAMVVLVVVVVVAVVVVVVLVVVVVRM